LTTCSDSVSEGALKRTPLEHDLRARSSSTIFEHAVRAPPYFSRMRSLRTFAVVALIPWSAGFAQDRSQSRSLVSSTSGIVASESVLASQVGANILERGGNAIDAAVATNAMMGLVAPMNDGIGGDLFAIVYIAKEKK